MKWFTSFLTILYYRQFFLIQLLHVVNIDLHKWFCRNQKIKQILRLPFQVQPRIQEKNSLITNYIFCRFKSYFLYGAKHLIGSKLVTVQRQKLTYFFHPAVKIVLVSRKSIDQKIFLAWLLQRAYHIWVRWLIKFPFMI